MPAPRSEFFQRPRVNVLRSFPLPVKLYAPCVRVRGKGHTGRFARAGYKGSATARLRAHLTWYNLKSVPMLRRKTSRIKRSHALLLAAPGAGCPRFFYRVLDRRANRRLLIKVC